MPATVELISRPELSSFDHSRLITEREVERAYGLNRRTLQHWRLNGTGIPWIKIGRMIRYRIADIERFLANNTHGGDR